MIGLAVMAWLTVLICYGGNWVLGQCMIERPLVVGLVAGLLMGDVKTGVIIGASLEAIFMGAVNIGGAISAEPVTATALAVAFTVGAGIDQGARHHAGRSRWRRHRVPLDLHEQRVPRVLRRHL